MEGLGLSATRLRPGGRTASGSLTGTPAYLLIGPPSNEAAVSRKMKYRFFSQGGTSLLIPSLIERFPS